VTAKEDFITVCEIMRGLPPYAPHPTYFHAVGHELAWKLRESGYPVLSHEEAARLNPLPGGTVLYEYDENATTTRARLVH